MTLQDMIRNMTKGSHPIIVNEDINRVVETTNKLVGVHSSRSMCMPLLSSIDSDRLTGITRKPVSWLSLGRLNYYGIWIPCPEPHKYNIAGVAITLSLNDFVRNVLSENEQDVVVVNLAYVTPNGSIVAFNTDYHLESFSHLHIDEFFRVMLPPELCTIINNIADSAFYNLRDHGLGAMISGIGSLSQVN